MGGRTYWSLNGFPMHNTRLHGENGDQPIIDHCDSPKHTLPLPHRDTEFQCKQKLCSACLKGWRTTNTSPAGYNSIHSSYPNSSTIFSNSNIVVTGGKFIATNHTTTGECSYIPPHVKIISDKDGINWWTTFP